jgi:hypothetical protein
LLAFFLFDKGLTMTSPASPVCHPSRSIRLKDILLPINIIHGGLATERMPTDTGEARVDVLEIDVFIRYAHTPHLSDGTFSGVFSYSGIYNRLCEGPVRTVTSPLETILDEVMDVTEELARAQNIELVEVEVSAERKGLDVGRPVMQAHRTYQHRPLPVPMGPTRVSGFHDLPVQVVINHGWVAPGDQVEHVPSRRETVLLGFEVTTASRPLDPTSLRGLFNYVLTHQAADARQGEEITGPLELITDHLMEAMEAECARQGLEPLKLECRLQRTGFTRCVAVIGLQRVYG